MKLKKQIQNIISSWTCCLDPEHKQLNKAIMKAVNKKVKSINIGEIFKNFIWGDYKKDINDLIIHIKESIIKKMK